MAHTPTTWRPLGPRESKSRIVSLIAKGENEGARVILDGRASNELKFNQGNFLTPTLLDNTPAESALSTTEIFGPVLSLVHAQTLDEGIEILTARIYR